MRRGRVATLAFALLLSCSGRGEIIPTPVQAPEVPTTLEAAEMDLSAGTTTTIEPEPTTTVAPAPEPVVEVSTTRRTTTTVAYVRTTQTTSAPVYSSSDELADIRACESNGNYSTNTGNGYYGAYQFALSTWQSVGGSGNPAHASPAEQDMRAQMMIDSGRREEWPNC